MAATDLFILCLLAAAVSAAAGKRATSATPPGGCTKDVCDSYKAVSVKNVKSDLDYADKATWTSPDLPGLKYIAYYMGVYNKAVNGGVYAGDANWTRAKGGPALNFQRYGTEAQYMLRSVTNPVQTDLAGCCNACRVTKKCTLFQYFQERRLCFLLKGGSQEGDNPKGVPPVGSAEEQAADNSTKPSFVGGHCNPGSADGNVEDDPHFTGAHGTHFDFKGELDRTFCLLTDARFHVNALLGGYRADAGSGGPSSKVIRSWIRELGVLWADDAGRRHSLLLVARSGKQAARGVGFITRAVLDGKEVAVPAAPGECISGGNMRLTFVEATKKGPYDLDKLRLSIGDLLDAGISLRVAHPLLQTHTEAFAHFNLAFDLVQVSEAVHGVLGQTYRSTAAQELKALRYSQLSQLLGHPIRADGPEGTGFLDGSVADYAASSVLSSDCAVSAFAK